MLAVSLLLIAVLVSFGFSLEERLSPSTLSINGTESQRANEMLRTYFGDSAPFVVLLEGPPDAIDRQGPELIRKLRRDPKVTTLSPWDRGTVDRLRPEPDRALIVVDFHVDTAEAVDKKVPLLNSAIEEEIRSPVRATQSGFATLTRTIQDKSIEAAERGELIALPILLVVLLLVFRSPVAAAIPLAFGAISVFASRGLLSILTGLFGVDAIALTVCTMMGLALGVDYALLLVSRFREELASGAIPLDAAWATRRTAGRTTVFAGSTLILSMVVALFVVPGALLASLAGTLALVVLLTVVVATVIGPPILLLLGPNIDRWRIGPAPNGERSRLMKLVGAALARPAPVAALIGGIVLVLAAPALALKTGPFDTGQLPPDDPARLDAERIQAAFAGFEAPFVVVAAAKQGTITEPARLNSLRRWQRHIANTPGVQSVVGPGQVSEQVEPLRRTGNALLASDEDTGPLAGFTRLSRNLGRVAEGVSALRGGLSRATYGAGLLSEGSGRAEEGAIAIAQGLGEAVAGGDEAIEGVDRLAEGSRQLAAGLERAAVGGLRIKFGNHDLVPNLNANVSPESRRLARTLEEETETVVPQLHGAAQRTDEQLGIVLQQLEAMTVGKSDPNYDAALEAARQAAGAASPLATELAALQTRLEANLEDARTIKAYLESELQHMRQLAAASKQLSDGLFELSGGADRLAEGIAELNRETKGAIEELAEADSATSQLAAGLTQLTDGTEEFERQLSEFYTRSYPLQSGTRQLTVRIESQGRRINRQVAQVRRTTPGIFDSGYFVLSALDGTRGRLHERASEAVNLEGGGQAATLVVFSRYPFNSDGSIALNKRLEDDAAKLGKEADVATGVAGGPATLNAYSRITRERMPLVIAAITLATFLILVLVLRALPLAAIAVGLNLATVAVAFGVLTLLTNVPEGWPLGGRTYVDAVGATMIFGVVFGLSIDYAVFLLVRMREHYDRHGDNAAAIDFGLEKTARVITGAAAIMMAVFLAFAGAPIATVSQLGIGLTVAVLLDATVVRIVLLPALMLLIGERVWWLPRSLERALPRLNV
ncbi:MAG TPA: MMPL family transporter [Solirubrobacterales bacterium]|nr:MMPL family transporter [Solirubrobacterales bacterium]